MPSHFQRTRSLLARSTNESGSLKPEFAAAIKQLTGIIVPAPLMRGGDPQVTFAPQGVILALLTLSRIQDHWDALGESERGERVLQAFTHSMLLPGFWPVASTVAAIAHQRFRFAHQRIVDRFEAVYPVDPIRAHEEGTILAQISNKHCDDSQQRQLHKEYSKVIGEAAARGDTEFQELLGNALRDPKWKWEAPIQEGAYLIPSSKQHGATRAFARLAWLSHLYWLMPTQLIESPSLLDARQQQAKDTISRDKLPQMKPPAIEHVADGKSKKEAWFRFGKWWLDGPLVHPGDYPREVKTL